MVEKPLRRKLKAAQDTLGLWVTLVRLPSLSVLIGSLWTWTWISCLDLPVLSHLNLAPDN